jgi:hypothetical protein
MPASAAITTAFLRDVAIIVAAVVFVIDTL